MTPTLDAAVLQVLAATTGSISGGEAHRRAGVGSPDGVRRVLGRLVQQGIVLADPHPHATLYLLNREHVCAPGIVAIARVRTEIVDRITDALGGWGEAPLHASLFGSFARGEAGEDSDIDILLIRSGADLADARKRQKESWDEQVIRLATSILSWTGNQAHLVDVTAADLAAMVAARDPIVSSWRADHVALFGIRLSELLRRAS